MPSNIISAMATGPVVGGLIYDTHASYTWLFVTCFSLGIGAFLIALALKPFPARRPEAQPA